jgi:hypothetical protein
MPAELLITFETTDLALANENAEALAQHLGMTAPMVRTEIRRSDPNAQDLGASLVLVLGAPAIVALAKGIADWLRMQQLPQSKLVIRDREGIAIVEIDNARSCDIRALLEGKLGEAIGR